MTITSTEERLAHPEAADSIESQALPAPPIFSDSPAPSGLVVHEPWTWIDAEEGETPRHRTDWVTRFAWAKTAGAW